MLCYFEGSYVSWRKLKNVFFCASHYASVVRVFALHQCKRSIVIILTANSGIPYHIFIGKHLWVLIFNTVNTQHCLSRQSLFMMALYEEQFCQLIGASEIIKKWSVLIVARDY